MKKNEKSTRVGVGAGGDGGELKAAGVDVAWRDLERVGALKDAVQRVARARLLYLGRPRAQNYARTQEVCSSR